MKKLFFILLYIVLFFAGSTQALAQTPEASPTQGSSLTDQISNLKDKIASRVAQLKLVERRGVIGSVTDVSDTQITLSDGGENVRFIDVDELTKFDSGDTKVESFGISDIKKNSTLGILGLYNKQSRRVLARFVDVITPPVIISGTITQINASDFSFEIDTSEGRKYTIDVETTSRLNSYTKETQLTRLGFSKLVEYKRVHVVGNINEKNVNRISAYRIIVFPDLPNNPSLSIPQVDAKTASSSSTVL